MIAELLAGYSWRGKSGRAPFIMGLGLFVLALIGFKAGGILGGPFGALTTISILGMALMVYPMVGLAVRRLHDLGSNGGWAFLLLVPIVGVVLTIILMTLQGRGRLQQPSNAFGARAGQGVAILVALLFISRAFWSPYWIPSSSMKPGFLPGDFFAATNVETLTRGDIFVFTPAPGTELRVSRLIGLPGDEISLLGGEISINSAPLVYRPAADFVERFEKQGPLRVLPRCNHDGIAIGADCAKSARWEVLSDGISYRVLDIRETLMDNVDPIIVPAGQLFFIGDNRDNSADSRIPTSLGGVGMVPVENVIARAERILFSASGGSLWAFWKWRPGRFWTEIE